MKLKYKLFRKTFPFICTKCGKISNMEREFCENCGEEGSFRDTTKEDHAIYEEDKI